MNAPDASAAARVGSRAWWAFLLVAVVQFGLAAWQIGLPGVYMDAVNPDYLVARILNPGHERIMTWITPGNLVFERFPVLPQLYHGALTFWFGLPLYFVLGTSVEALRLVHATFGLAVLAALYALLLRVGLRAWQAALVCIALALDPVFTFAFRTQSYITLANDAALLLSITLLGRALRDPNGRRAYLLSGFFAGLAAYGYFIFLFYLPALFAVVAWKAVREPGTWRSTLWPWIAGTILGAGGYLLGYALLFRATGGMPEFVAYVTETAGKVGALDQPLPWWDRIRHGWKMVEWTVANTWHHALMFGEESAVPASGLKKALLLGLPVAVWLASEFARVATLEQRLLVGLPVCFFAGALVFASRIGGHHFVTILPLLYAALAVGMAGASKVRAPAAASVGSAMFVVAFGIAVAINVAGQQATRTRLAETGGRGLFSDAINRFADDLRKAERKPHVFAADWGVALPVGFLTKGTVPLTTDEDHALARRSLCRGRDVAVVMLTGDVAQRARAWGQALEQPPQAITPYRQRDGATVFQVVTFAASPGRPACERSPLPKP